jgi:hypothetical protein
MLNAFRLPGFREEVEITYSTAVSNCGFDKAASCEMANSDLPETDDLELEMSCESVDVFDPDVESTTESAFFSSGVHLSCPIHTTQLGIKGRANRMRGSFSIDYEGSAACKRNKILPAEYYLYRFSQGSTVCCLCNSLE